MSPLDVVPTSLQDVSGYPFALVICVLLLAVLVWLLRSQRLREKYAIIWFGVVVGLVVLGFVPAITTWLTTLTGVTTPINLVFILASLVLLVVCIQLSLEISHLEESSRTVSEEVALLRLEMERRLAAHEAGDRHTGPEGREGLEGDDGAALPPAG